MRSPIPSRLIPFILSAVITMIDQLTKELIVRSIPLNTIGAVFGEGAFLRIIHVQNKAVAFSMGDSLPAMARKILFIVVPVIVIILLVIYLIRSDEFTRFQRWTIALILGGGVGNIIDRIFRPLGVVDFIDVRFYGLFGLERWPTFNIADSAIVVGGILLIISLLTSIRRDYE
ncbi:MAG: signal peptidase II [Spirochaetia bacterium]|nr:signal peptidase II [Spirochaetia bacterium]MCF7940865.1 signal peptidase II [Spirochaetia bacterium]